MNKITTSLGDVFSRPADDNYDSIGELLAAAEADVNQSRQISSRGKAMVFARTNNAGQFTVTVNGTPLPLTHYSLTQCAGMAKIPTRVLERLHERERDDLIVDNMNTLFPNERGQDKFVLVRDNYTDDDISSVARAINGSAYSRLWDYNVFSEVRQILPKTYSANMPELATNAVRNGLMRGLGTALFRGDQSSFGFFFNESMDGETSHLGGLRPGIMIWNSEVGARSFGYHTFYYHEMSGSIIIWTPAKQRRKRFVHRGNITKAFREYVGVLEEVTDNFQDWFTRDLAVFTTAMTTAYAQDEDGVVQRLNQELKMPASSAKAVVLAARKKQNQYGNPLSVWNIALGICDEAGQTSRAESLVDNSMLATKLIRSALKV